MSEKGTLSKSIANNISEAIIDKLGGAGYAPTEWRENINLLGIASEDGDFAIASLQEEASTSEKGALSLSIASDVGIMLNKKYNTSRGFKPSEVSSAVSMLSPLPEKTASGAIAVIEDGADDVPTKSLVVTIPATLSGVSALNEKQSGRNLSSVSEYSSNPWSFWGTNFIDMISVLNMLPVETYTLSYTFEVAEVPDTNNISYGKPYIRALVNGNYVNLTPYSISDASGVSVGDQFTVSASFTITTETVGKIENVYLYCDKKESHSGTGRGSYNLINAMLEIGSTVHAFEPYTPTNYTASLGRTIYGGSADLVNGTAKPINLAYDEESHLFPRASQTAVINNNTWTAYAKVKKNTTYYVSAIGSTINRHICCGFGDEPNEGDLSTALTVTQVVADSVYTFNSGNYEYIGFYYSNVSASQIVISETQETVYSPYFAPFTFEAQEIPTKQGYNAFWADSGDTEVAYRAIQTPYERGTLTGGIINFDDADTNFPLVKLEADLAPTLDGKSAVEFTRCGKNLLQNDLTSQTVNGTTFTVNDYKSITISGTPTAQTRVYIKSGDFFKVKSTSFFSCGSMPTGTRIFCQKTTSGGTSSYPTISPTSTFNEADAVYSNMLLEVGTSFGGEEFTIYPMIEVGSSASDYTPYVPPTIFTASFGRTIYGGSADIEKGEGKGTHETIDMGTLTWQYDSANTRFFTVDLTSVIKRGASGWITDLAVSSPYTVASGTANDKTVSEYATTGYVYIKDTDYTDTTTFKASLSGKYLTYPLATPEDFTFDAQRVEALPGVNNFYNDIGDTDIEYIKTR